VHSTSPLSNVKLAGSKQKDIRNWTTPVIGLFFFAVEEFACVASSKKILSHSPNCKRLQAWCGSKQANMSTLLAYRIPRDYFLLPDYKKTAYRHCKGACPKAARSWSLTMHLLKRSTGYWHQRTCCQIGSIYVRENNCKRSQLILDPRPSCEEF